jgi:hypothetical protein
LAVELPDELSENQGVSIVQGDRPLEEDEAQRGCWRLAQLRGDVTVRTLEADDYIIPLHDDGYLLFKLSGGDLSQGRRVRQVSAGSYLAIVPAIWERDEEKAGTAPVTPQPVCLESCQAHFFDLKENEPSQIAFRGCGRAPVVGGPRFQLVGQEVRDASEHLGPLFGGSPPRISIAEGSWSDVGTIVVGEEGSGRGWWRTRFKPRPDQPEQDLPAEIVSRKAGWYFMRFYNFDDELIDSLDFRFVGSLREIKFPQDGPIPSSTGHSAATVEFLHDADCYVDRLSDGGGDVTVERTGERTILSIPATPECRSRWVVRSGHGQVEVTILVERAWWAVGTVATEPSEWEGRPACLSPEDFRATSEKAIWLRLPKAR